MARAAASAAILLIAPAAASADGKVLFEGKCGACHKKDGTGLGLWISRSIVERYGGDIRAANRAEGGAAFCVLLRVDGKAQSKIRQGVTTAIAGEGGTPGPAEALDRYLRP